MESASPASTPSPLELEQKKSRFEMVVTSTPVLLTVIATFLVGQSTSEMTRAQYYRSLASQNQSKAGDQWGFYQAKRIRGQILDGTADVLRSQNPVLFSRETFVDAAQAMAQELTRAEADASNLAEIAESATATTALAHEIKSVAAELKTLAAEGERAVERNKSLLNPPAGGWKGDKHTLDAKTLEAALSAVQPFVGATANPEKSAAEKATGKPADTMDPKQRALLDAIVADIKQRKHESEFNTPVLQLQETTLLYAIKEKDHLADEVFQRGKSIENVLEEFDVIVDRQTALTFAFQRVAARLQTVLDRMNSALLAKKSANEASYAAFRSAWDRWKASSREIGQVPVRLQSVYNAARHAYSARRYEDDARSNQDSAYLYEVRVYLNSARSDRHLYRSKMFLFAMLVAQAGVTIATLALAVRRRSVFWLLATITGLIAIGFGLYVYLDLGPMLM